MGAQGSIPANQTPDNVEGHRQGEVIGDKADVDGHTQAVSPEEVHLAPLIEETVSSNADVNLLNIGFRGESVLC